MKELHWKVEVGVPRTGMVRVSCDMTEAQARRFIGQIRSLQRIIDGGKPRKLLLAAPRMLSKKEATKTVPLPRRR